LRRNRAKLNRTWFQKKILRARHLPPLKVLGLRVRRGAGAGPDVGVADVGGDARHLGSSQPALPKMSPRISLTNIAKRMRKIDTSRKRRPARMKKPAVKGPKKVMNE
jgi:hypothetical protein